MKPYIYSLLVSASLFVGISTAQAQSFETEGGDTVRGTVYKNLDLHNNITNKTGANIQIEWKVVAHDFPASWSGGMNLGICDNALCRQNSNNQLLNGSTFTSNDYAPNVKGDFHVQLADYDASTIIPGTYYITVNMKEKGGTYNKNVTFIFSKWTTSVGNINQASDRVNIYPNPANNVINVQFGKYKNIENVSIYNLVGRKMASYNVSSNSSEAKLNIEKIPTGVYFIRLSDSNGNIVTTRRFTHM
ncbi:MAG: T9SS type A sorting domain-containing protein [Flavipsychrobacter sp.]